MSVMKYFFYGSKAYGKKLIAELEKHGANNSAFLSGTSEDKLYYTTDDGMICSEFIDSEKGEAIINTYDDLIINQLKETAMNLEIKITKENVCLVDVSTTSSELPEIVETMLKNIHNVEVSIVRKD